MQSIFVQTLRFLLIWIFACVFGGLSTAAIAADQGIEFADDGELKMLYDNRMYPQAVRAEGKVHIVWRGRKGRPFVRSYDLSTGKFSDPVSLLDGIEDQLKTKTKSKFAKDHHYAPVLWIDRDGYLHTLFGCHRTPGIHRVSKKPHDPTSWVNAPVIAPSISYPKVHRIFDGKTLVFFRDLGHLGSWQYRISSDGGKTWDNPHGPIVDLNAPPANGYLAGHAGSYDTTRMSVDGKTLHVAFIWKVEDPVMNKRYGKLLDDQTQRYNLYYLKVDLTTGEAFNYKGQPLAVPVTKKTADELCLVWDTKERVAAVGPSIYLDKNDRASFVLPVSGQTPYTCRFYFVRLVNDAWKKTPIAGTSHPFNSCHLIRAEDGSFLAYLITGTGESISDQGMDRYGWGDRVELWKADPSGENWKLQKDLTPKAGLRYQNIQFVRLWEGQKRGEQGHKRGLEQNSEQGRRISRDLLLFYGWKPGDSGGQGRGYLLDTRK